MLRFLILLTFLQISFSRNVESQNIDSLKAIAKSNTLDSLKADAFYNLANAYIYENSDSAITYYNSCIDLTRKIKEDPLRYKALNALSSFYVNNSKYIKAKEGYSECLEIALGKNDSVLITASHSSLGSLYTQIELNDKAIYHLKEASRYINIKKHPDEAGKLYGRIGNFYLYQGYYNEAEQNFKKARALFNISKNLRGIIIATQNLGVVEKRRKNYDSAINYYNQAISSYESINYLVGIGECLANIGNIQTEKGAFEDAIKNYNDALKIFKRTNQKNDEVLCYAEIADMYNKQKNYGKALEEINKSKSFLSSVTNNDNTKSALLHQLHITYRNIGNIDLAYKYLLEYQTLSDTLQKYASKAKVETLQIQYEVEQKDRDIKLLTIENELKDTKLKRKSIFQLFYLIIITLSLIAILLLFRLFRIKNKANEVLTHKNNEILQQKEEIETQREEIEAQRDDLEIQRSIAIQQRDEITRQKNNITDSITYAKHIQTAMLPSDNEVLVIIPNNFILFKPLDIVSGDFYWVNNLKDHSVLAVADCTGHGVPGAFMSVMGINFLNSIVVEQEIFDPGVILNRLNQHVISALSHADTNMQDNDGMDISLCCIDMSKMIMSYSCARNRIIVCRGGELFQLDAGRYSIGKSPFVEKIEFVTNYFTIQQGDMVYLMTDGYVDQFGGPQRVKFLFSRLKKTILEIAHLDSKEQKSILEKTIEEWQGHYPQIDDMLIVGFRV